MYTLYFVVVTPLFLFTIICFNIETLLSGGEDHIREFLQELKTANLNEEDVVAGECSICLHFLQIFDKFSSFL